MLKRDKLLELADQVLEHLSRAGSDLRERGPERWRGACPLCGDDTLELKVDLSEDRWFLGCWHATCTTELILESIGLTWDDLRLDREASGGELVRRRFDQVKFRPVEFLVGGLIPVQAVTCLVGDPFAAKSTLAAYYAAGVTRGEYGEPATVAILNAEDAAEVSTGPRLRAADADLARVEELTISTGEYERIITLPDDVPKLETWVIETGARLLVLDPLMMFISEQADTNKDHGIRRALAGLAMMAERRNLAVLVAAHLNKDEAKRMLYRVGGSVGLVGLARSVLFLTHDPDDPDGETGNLRLLAHAASNWGERSTTLRYRIEEVSWEEDGQQIRTSKVVPDGESDLTAEQLIAPHRSREPSKVELAEDAICEALEAGPRLSSEVKTTVSQAVDCRHATIERAATELRLAQVLGSSGSGPATRWFLLTEPPQPPPKREEEEVQIQTDTPSNRGRGSEEELPPPQLSEEPEEVREAVWNGFGADDRARVEEELRRRERR